MNIRPMESMKQAVAGARRLCLFGVGVLLMECYDQLILALGREPDIFCDNAPEKWGREFYGKRCISPAELAEGRDGMVVIVTVRKYESISEQIYALGVRDVFVARFDRCFHSLSGISTCDDKHMVAASVQKSDSIDLNGKWTLVTGASRGIGREIALAMARLGSHIIAHSRSIDHVAEVVQACSEYGVQVVPIAAELANLNEVETMLASIEQHVPRVDIIFNNAAIHVHGPWSSDYWSVSSSLFHDCFAVNAIAPALICQKLIPPMIRRGFGRVVNVHTKLQYVPGEIPYVCSKAAMDKYVHDMAPTLNNTGVTMTLADPGWVRTDAGGPGAPNAVESVIPGMLLGVVLDNSFNGCDFSAQEYAGLTLEAAQQRARQRRQLPITWV